MAELYWYSAKCLNVVDGDTVDLDVDLGFGTHIHDRFRLAGINTPEISGVAKDTPEYLAGIAAKERVTGLILNKTILVHTKKNPKDKYGRYLAYLFVGDVNVNDLLVTEKLAVPYMING